MTIIRRTKRDVQDQARREKLQAFILKDLSVLFAQQVRVGLNRVRDIPADEWQLAIAKDVEKEQRDAALTNPGESDKEMSERGEPWETLVDQLPAVGQLVHERMRLDDTDEMQIRAELTAQRARAYEDELVIQAGRVGCDSYRGRLTIGPEWADMDGQSVKDARSIVNTFNRDLARRIRGIRKDVPTANRYVYAKRLRIWQSHRASWKDAQVAQHTDISARSKAQQDFYQKNGLAEGYAVLQPRSAVCPICQGFLNRGRIALNVALANPGPYHPNCPHLWDIHTPALSPDDCANLWKPGLGG